jgi:hypothetical protein
LLVNSIFHEIPIKLPFIITTTLRYQFESSREYEQLFFACLNFLLVAGVWLSVLAFVAF